jgi:hypothetical protein
LGKVLSYFAIHDGTNFGVKLSEFNGWWKEIITFKYLEFYPVFAKLHMIVDESAFLVGIALFNLFGCASRSIPEGTLD